VRTDDQVADGFGNARPAHVLDEAPDGRHFGMLGHQIRVLAAFTQ
jgi:hypothetical protein